MTSTEERAPQLAESGRRRVGFGLAVVVVLLLGLALLLWRSAGRKPEVPKTTAATKREATKLYGKGEFKKALPKLRSYVAGHADDVEARSLLASSYWLSGKPNKALSEYLLILKRETRDADTLYRVGILYQQLGKPELSLDYLRKAVDAGPKIPLFRAELAKALQREGKYNDAVDQWQSAINLTPGNKKYQAVIYAQLGDTHVLRKDDEAARRAYEEGLKLDPENEYLRQRLEKFSR